MTRRPGVKHLGPLLVMGVIFGFSSLPGSPDGAGTVPALPPWLHNLAHIPAYALLAASWCLALGAPRKCPNIPLIGLLTIGYGVLDEWHQSFVPGRDCSAADLLRDALGAAIGLAATRWLQSLRPARARPAARDQ